MALGHHAWYDGSGGYPDSYVRLECPCRRYSVFFLMEIRYFPDGIHVVEEAGLLLQDNPAESGGRPAHGMGMDNGASHGPGGG